VFSPEDKALDTSVDIDGKADVYEDPEYEEKKRDPADDGWIPAPQKNDEAENVGKSSEDPQFFTTATGIIIIIASILFLVALIVIGCKIKKNNDRKKN